MDPPAGFVRAHSAAPRGAWSDDGAQALCLLASLLHRGALDVSDLGRRLVNWYEHGYMAVGNVVFDVGVTTAQALRRIREGHDAASAGSNAETSLGNGALMRVLPLALWHHGPDAELALLAQRQSLVTHGHPRSQLCCALYCLWARALMHGGTWEDALANARRIYANDRAMIEQLQMHLRPEDDGKVTGSGYVVDCLRSSVFVMRQAGYEAVVKHAIALGNDTDTTACVAGGVAGLRDGVHAIPTRWLDALAEKETVEPLLAELVRRRG